jgi:hypothetical protein
MSNTIECDECNMHYNDNKTYIETIYEGTTYSDLDPEPIDWKCPKHPNAGTALVSTPKNKANASHR